ncbi:hypothetical protein EU537_01015 [Candidatus Thorarchaeota archaeon]|nr:MAG: hypothetical protein EU537_01015 [Candidatus Thorarchaeota archaeon]
MWTPLIEHEDLESLLNDKGLAQIGDNLVNLCYSIAKSIVLHEAMGVKVRDSVLARAIRSTKVYDYMTGRCDVGCAGDAYEAIMAWLWMKEKVTIESLIQHLIPLLEIDSTTSRKREGEVAAAAFQSLLETHMKKLPHPRTS